MADPITLAIAGSAVLNAVGTFQQGRARADASEFNAQIAEQNAALARQQGAENADRTRREGRRRAGAIRAAFGASGVSLEGSPIDVLTDQAVENELDALTAENQGLLQSTAFQNTASLDRANARNSRTGAIIGAGASLLSGASQIGSRTGFGTSPSRAPSGSSPRFQRRN